MEGRYCLQKSCRKSWSPPLGSTYTSSSRPRLLLLKNLSVEEAAHRQLKGRPLELLEGSGTIYKSDAEPEMGNDTLVLPNDLNFECLTTTTNISSSRHLRTITTTANRIHLRIRSVSFISKHPTPSAFLVRLFNYSLSQPWIYCAQQWGFLA